MQSSKFDNHGFTLIEVIIVMAIIGIILTIIVPRYSNYRDSKGILLGLNQLSNDIRMTQNYSYSTLKFNGNYPLGGYGIRFTKGSNKYTIFADLDEDKEYDNPMEKFKEEELPENVKIESMKINSVDTGLNPVDLVFVPPYGRVYINKNNKSGGNFINLEIKIANPIDSKIISVRSSGLIN